VEWFTSALGTKFSLPYTRCFPPALRWRTPHLASAKIENLRLSQTKNNFASNSKDLIPKALVKFFFTKYESEGMVRLNILSRGVLNEKSFFDKFCT